MNILISINDNFVDMAINMLNSVHLYNDDELKVYLIYYDLKDESINKLKSFLEDNNIGELIPMYYDFSSYDFPIKIPHISRETYFRLFAPYVLPKNMERILYLDCDIICNGNISELYNLDFEGNIFAGVENIDPDPLFMSYIKERIDFPMDSIYINAGVLLINLKEYRKFITIDEIVKYIEEKYEYLTCQDQDVINKLFFGHIKFISDEFNYQINHISGDSLDYENKKLIHYLSPPKPWRLDYNLPFHGVIYYRYLLKIEDYDTLNTLVMLHITNANLNIYDIKYLLDLIF